jgi:hypothetical protein
MGTWAKKGDPKTPGSGRKSKLTPELTEEFCGYITRDMVSVKAAAALVGVCEWTAHEWRKLGEQHLRDGKRTRYAAFAMALAKALAEVERECVRKLRTAQSWWRWEVILARRFPRDWGQQLKLQGDEDAPIRTEAVTVDVGAVLADEELRRLAAGIVSRASGRPPEPSESGGAADPG